LCRRMRSAQPAAQSPHQEPPRAPRPGRYRTRMSIRMSRWQPPRGGSIRCS
jgi:hypothetical protein